MKKHKVIAILFSLMLFTYNISNIAVVIDFAIHQDEIAKTLCVQKENQKGCNGKCQLTKRLQVLDKDHQPLNTNENSKISLIDLVFVQPQNSALLQAFKLQPKVKPQVFIQNEVLSWVLEIPTPPPNLRHII